VERPLVVTSKRCYTCSEVKDLDSFSNYKKSKDGKYYQCKSCKAESAKKSYLRIKDSHLSKCRNYHAKNREKILAQHKLYYKENKSDFISRAAHRKSRKINATPDWLTKEHKQEIQQFYWLAQDLKTVTGESYHVDHIVPLKGENVCGLHVPWNLQVLPADINLSKGNKYGNFT
jgi:hypothetical protein